MGPGNRKGSMGNWGERWRQRDGLRGKKEGEAVGRERAGTDGMLGDRRERHQIERGQKGRNGQKARLLPRLPGSPFPPHQVLQQGSSPDSPTSSLPTLNCKPPQASIWVPTPTHPAPTRLPQAGLTVLSLSQCQSDAAHPSLTCTSTASKIKEAASMTQRFPYQFCCLF